MGHDLTGEPAGDLAHGGQQRQVAIGVFDGFVSHAGRPGTDQSGGERRVGGEVKISKKNESFVQERELWFDRLFDFDQEVHVGPNLRRVVDDEGAGIQIGRVLEARTFAGPFFDQYRIAPAHQFCGACRR